jgi:nicotinamidase-related amidase
MSKALLIIDIQNDYFATGANPLHDALEASLNAKRILQKFRENGLPVIHIQHLSTRSDATFFIPNTNGAELHPNVSPLANERVVVKHFPNSFRDTDLLDILNNLGVNELVVCGMMTHMCVDATVRAAKDFRFTCTVVGDACATRNLAIDGHVVKAADVHRSFLAALSYFYADVVTTNDILGK